jgi:hypothetical protein
VPEQYDVETDQEGTVFEDMCLTNMKYMFYLIVVGTSVVFVYTHTGQLQHRVNAMGPAHVSAHRAFCSRKSVTALLTLDCHLYPVVH